MMRVIVLTQPIRRPLRTTSATFRPWPAGTSLTEVTMPRRLLSLFVGVLAAVGVSIRGLELAPAAPMSKHWPREETPQAIILMVGVFATILALVGVMLANAQLVVAYASLTIFR
jgi:uncharacterized membrane protein